MTAKGMTRAALKMALFGFVCLTLSVYCLMRGRYGRT